MTGHWSLFKLMILLGVGHSSSELCDRVSSVQNREGNLGQSGDFNWLGVLHVQLDEDWIATTGIVLVKTKYALAIADDVARIPQNIFKSYSKAIFLPVNDTPWFFKPTSCVTHPEYEYATLNTIAVIELDLHEDDDIPLTPICLGDAKEFSSSKYLYLVGFTHENHISEKVIYKIQYLEEKVCEERENRTTELSSQGVTPSSHWCGYAPNSASPCVWDNGMTLVSNSFGYLNLIGFSVHGPGCASPARFIDLVPYYHWINSVTDESNYRRNEFVPYNRRKAFVPQKKGAVQNVPIHELYTMGGSRRQGALVHHFEAYPSEFNALKFHLIEPVKDGNAYMIFPFKEKWEKSEGSCDIPTAVIYEEVFKVKASDHLLGTATYKLSLYDKLNSECLCVRLTVNCIKRSDAILSFKEVINFKEDTEEYNTPEEILKYFPNPIREPKLPILKPSYITDDYFLSQKVLNYDLYITFKFKNQAELKFEMLAEKPIPTTTPKPTTANETKTVSEEDKENKVKGRSRVEIKNQTEPISRKGQKKTEVNRKDGMVEEAEVREIAARDDIEALAETRSAARRKRTAVLCYLIGIFVLKALFIY